jgi:hypothetical protein
MKRALTVLPALILGATFLAACGSGPSSPRASGSTTTQAPSHRTTTATSGAATTTTVGPVGTTTTESGDAGDGKFPDYGTPVNQTATAAVKSGLTAAYVAHADLPASQVAGTAPGTVYYAYFPQTKTYWAIAQFLPIQGSATSTQVVMQDDGCCGIFTSPDGLSFTQIGIFLGSPCAAQLPSALFTLWNVQPGGECPS